MLCYICAQVYLLWMFTRSETFYPEGYKMFVLEVYEKEIVSVHISLTAGHLTRHSKRPKRYCYGVPSGVKCEQF